VVKKKNMDKYVVKKVSFPIHNGHKNLYLILYSDDSIAMVSSYNDGYGRIETDDRDILENIHKELGKMLYGE